MKRKKTFPIRAKSPLQRKFRKKRKREEELARRNSLHGSTALWRPSHVVSLLRKKMIGQLRGQFRPDQHAWVIPVPKQFSLISNPDESLDVIYTLISVSRDERVRRIVFDHSKCEEMDLGASVVLDVVAMEIRNEWRSKRQKRGFAGKFPENARVKDMFICTGLYRRLGLKVPPERLEKYEIYPLYIGKKARGDQSRGGTDQVEAATLLAVHVDKCLSFAGYRLSDDGKWNLARWAGEIIANAEDHSGEDTWYVIAHMDKSAEGVEGECHLAVFGFGASIFESLNQPSTPEETKRAFRVLTEKHRTKGFFDMVLSGGLYREPDLWTLYALQERVSRFNGLEGSYDRGTGTVEMIEAFQSFGGSANEEQRPVMTLISGDSRILFDGRYHLKRKAAASPDGEVHQVIAFNDSDDLDDRPDNSCVHGLRAFLPGTIISFKFFVDERHLASQSAHVAKNHQS